MTPQHATQVEQKTHECHMSCTHARVPHRLHESTFFLIRVTNWVRASPQAARVQKGADTKSCHRHVRSHSCVACAVTLMRGMCGTFRCSAQRACQVKENQKLQYVCQVERNEVSSRPPVPLTAFSKGSFVPVSRHPTPVSRTTHCVTSSKSELT